MRVIFNAPCTGSMLFCLQHKIHRPKFPEHIYSFRENLKSGVFTVLMRFVLLNTIIFTSTMIIVWSNIRYLKTSPHFNSG